MKIFEYGAVRISDNMQFAHSDEEAWKGEFRAFVSRSPEFSGYGRYALVFHDSLREHEDGSPRAYTVPYFNTGIWIAFTEDLPVNQRCFDKVLLNSHFHSQEGRERERKNLEDKISKVAGRSISVQLYDDS